MMGLLYIVLAIIALGVACYLYERKRPKQQPTAEPEKEQSHASTDGGACCGLHLVCERDTLLLDPRSETLYYDDEELDAYAGRAADAYTPDEIQAFEEVFFTLLPEDVQGWLISLQRRGIQLPEALEPAVWLVVREQREQKSAAKKKDQE